MRSCGRELLQGGKDGEKGREKMREQLAYNTRLHGNTEKTISFE